MSQLLGTRIDRQEAQRRIASAPGARLTDDGFIVTGPRTVISPLFEAVGRWLPAGGVVVDVRPRALRYIPLVVVNAVLFVVIFGAVAFFGARRDIGFVIQGIGVGALALFGIGVIVQLVPIAYLEWRHGPAQRAALLMMLRDRLGP